MSLKIRIIGIEGGAARRPLPDELRADVFYDRQFRTWVSRVLDADGNQVVDCEYDHAKADALACAERMLEVAKKKITEAKS